MAKKKGQISLEFLTTYGWAFMVALIAIGALAYFGVLNPAKYTPKRCNFASEITCNDFRLDLPSVSLRPAVRFRLTNNIGTTVVLSALEVTNDAAVPLDCTAGAGATFTMNGGAITFGTDTWSDGAVTDFLVSNCALSTGAFVVGDKNKIKVKLTYYDPLSGSGYSHIVNGELYDEVIGT